MGVYLKDVRSAEVGPDVEPETKLTLSQVSVMASPIVRSWKSRSVGYKQHSHGMREVATRGLVVCVVTPRCYQRGCKSRAEFCHNRMPSHSFSRQRTCPYRRKGRLSWLVKERMRDRKDSLSRNVRIVQDRVRRDYPCDDAHIHIHIPSPNPDRPSPTHTQSFSLRHHRFPHRRFPVPSYRPSTSAQPPFLDDIAELS